MKFLFFLALSVFCFSGFSQTAYVDFDKVFEQTKHGRSIRAQFQKELESRRNIIQKREKKLQEEQMKLNSEASLLSDSEKRKRVQKMQQQAMELQRSLESNERELEEYKNNLIVSMEKNLQPILAKLAKKHGLSKIERLTKVILWIPKEKDFTAQVIKAYNKKHK